MEGDKCSFRHDLNERGKITPSNPSPNCFMQQNERKSSRTRNPRRRSPSGRMTRWPCKDCFKGICNNSFCEKWHPPECLFYKTKSGCRFEEKCSFAHRQVDYIRRDSATGVIRTLSGIDFFFLHPLVAEARDFHCYSHVFENVGNWTIPSGHAEVRLVIQKPTTRGHMSKLIPSLDVKTSRFLILFATASRRPQILSSLFLCTRRVKKQTIREFSRKTSDSLGARRNILGHSCGFARHGSQLKITLIQSF